MSKFLSVRERLFCCLRTGRCSVGTLLFLVLAILPLTVLAAPIDEEEVVVVTATRLPQPVLEVPAVVSVIPLEEPPAGIPSLPEVLETDLTAFPTSHGGPGAATVVNLQGASSAQVQVLVDGRPVSTGLAPADLTLLPTTDLARIEVVKGPASSLYGANALGGVINLITRPATGEPESRFETAAGGFGLFRASIVSGGKAGPVAYRLTGGREESAGWRPNSDSGRDFLTTRLDWRALGGEASFSTRYMDGEQGTPGTNGDYGTYPASLTSRQQEGLLTADLSFHRKGRADWTARLYHTNESLKYDDDSFDWHSVHHSVTNGGEARVTLEAGDHRLVLGADYRADGATSTNFTGDKSASNLGFYVEDVFLPSSPWSFTAGGRLDAHSVYGQVFSPRVGATYQFGQAERFWVSAGKAFRAPSFEDLYWDDGRYFGDPNLRPETSVAYQAGVTLGGANLSVFHKDVRDNIHWEGTQVKNLEATRYDGAEFSYRWPLSRFVDANLGFTYLRPVNVQTGNQLEYLASTQGALGLSAVWPWGYTARLAIKASGPRFADRENTVEVPGYARLDLSLARQVSPSLSWQVKLDNALNAGYQELPGYPMPGASLTASLSYRF